MRSLTAIILFLFLVSCKETKTLTCLERMPLYLYSAMNDDFLKIFNSWKLTLSKRDKEFVEDLEQTISRVSKISDTLTEQMGGVDPKDNDLMYPCRTDNNIARLISKQWRDELKKEVNSIASKYKEERYQNYILTLTYIMETSFYGKDHLFDTEKLSKETYSMLLMEFLLVEQTLYYQIQLALDGQNEQV